MFGDVTPSNGPRKTQAGEPTETQAGGLTGQPDNDRPSGHSGSTSPVGTERSQTKEPTLEGPLTSISDAEFEEDPTFEVRWYPKDESQRKRKVRVGMQWSLPVLFESLTTQKSRNKAKLELWWKIKGDGQAGTGSSGVFTSNIAFRGWVKVIEPGVNVMMSDGSNVLDNK